MNTFKYACLLGSLALSVAQGEVLVTTAHLSGPAEFPPVNSPGTGFAVVTYDSTAHTLRVEVTFSGLLAGVTASHIHGPIPAPPGNPTAGVITALPTFPGFPLGVTEGEYDRTFDLTQASSFNPAFVNNSGGLAAAETRLANALRDGTSYLNIHSSMFTGGEIRGFLRPDADTDGVPDAQDAFPNSRDVRANILVEGCDTGVPNVLFEDGSTISDQIYAIAGSAKNHGQFVSGVARLKNDFRRMSVLTAGQAAAVQACAASARLP